MKTEPLDGASASTAAGSQDASDMEMSEGAEAAAAAGGRPTARRKLASDHEWCAACNVYARRTLIGHHAGIGSEGELPGDKDGDLAPREQSHSPAPIRAGKTAFALSQPPVGRPGTLMMPYQDLQHASRN